MTEQFTTVHLVARRKGVWSAKSINDVFESRA